MTQPGTLYLVATPIGNLEDITLRAIRVLKEAHVVACEDTRHTKGLLSHFDIHTPTLSLHEHNERARIPQILALLREGRHVAVVSDAGTPAVSDPGGLLVAAAARAGIAVVAVPGASAVISAVTLADFPAERFAFVGFLPRRRAERRRMLDSLAGLSMALVIFEAPHRIRGTLADLAERFGDRRILLVRELTKLHEQVLRGTAAEIAAALDETPRGEVTLVIEGGRESPVTAETPGGAARQVADRHPPELLLKQLLARGLSRRDAARVLELVYAMPSRAAYRMAIEGE